MIPGFLAPGQIGFCAAPICIAIRSVFAMSRGQLGLSLAISPRLYWMALRMSTIRIPELSNTESLGFG